MVHMYHSRKSLRSSRNDLRSLMPKRFPTQIICIASLALVFFCRPFLFRRGRSKVSYMTRLEGACWRVTSNHPRTTLIRGYFQTGSKNSGGNLWLLLRPRLGLSTFSAQERQLNISAPSKQKSTKSGIINNNNPETNCVFMGHGQNPCHIRARG